MEVPPLITYALGWFALGSAVWVLFERAETVITAEFRREISSRLRNVDPGKAVRDLPQTFGQMFDAVFGARHVSWKCFRRSVVASLAAVTVMSIVSLTVNPIDDVREYLRSDLLSELPVFLILGAVCLNVVPDYLSLLESRLIIRFLQYAQRSVTRLLLLAVDLIITLAIFGVVAGVVLRVSIRAAFREGWYLDLDDLSEAVEALIELLPEWFALRPGGGYGQYFGIFLYSTFFTSVWIWLYLFGDLVLRLIAKARLDRVIRVLDVENKPLRSVGLVCNLGIAVLFAIAMTYSLLS